MHLSACVEYSWQDILLMPPEMTEETQMASSNKQQQFPVILTRWNCMYRVNIDQSQALESVFHSSNVRKH